MTSFDAALAAVRDPATSCADLTRIAQQYADMRYLVAVHPNADAVLLNWLDGLGDAFVCQAIAARRLKQPELAAPVSVPDVEVVAEVVVVAPAKVRRSDLWVLGVMLLAVCVLVAVIAVSQRSATLPMPSISLPDVTPTMDTQPVPTLIEPRLMATSSFGGTGTDVFNAVAAPAIVGDVPMPVIVAAGFTNSTDGDFPAHHKGRDGVVALMSGGSGITWAKTLGGDGDDEFYAVATDASDNIYVAGDTSSTDGDFPISHGGNADAVVVKLDWTGNVLWAKTFGGSGVDSFRALTWSDGMLIAAGFTTSPDGDFAATHGGQDAVLAEITTDGEIVWANTYGGSGDDSFASVAFDYGNIAAVGRSYSSDGDFPNSPGGANAIVMMVSDTGDMLWAEAYGGDGDDEFTGVAVTSNDDLVAVGDSNSLYGDFSGVSVGQPAGIIVQMVVPDGAINVMSPSGAGASWLRAVSVAANDTIAYAGNVVPDQQDMQRMATMGTAMGDSAKSLVWYGDGDSNFAGMVQCQGGIIAVVGQTSSTTAELSASHGGVDAIIAMFG